MNFHIFAEQILKYLLFWPSESLYLVLKDSDEYHKKYKIHKRRVIKGA